jgi:hypothetical protein
MCDASGLLMPDAKAQRRARILLTVAAILLTWSAVVAITGGFRLELWGLRISSRNALRIFLVGAVPAVWAWRLAYVERLDAWLVRSRPIVRRLAPALACLMAAGVLLLGARYGSHAVAASDQSGYVSEAALWARGTPRIDVGFAASLPWPDARDTLMPLGYRIGAGGAMVPTYAPGLPLLMALARAAGVCGPFLVMPFTAAMLVFFTFQLGRRLFDTGTALAGAALVACSPVMVFMSLTPMADLPAAAFWIGAMTMAIRGTPTATVVAAIFSGVAIVIRPNLVPLAVFPWLMAVVRWQSLSEVSPGLPAEAGRHTRQGVASAFRRKATAVANLWSAGRTTLLFAAGSIWAPIAVAWINNLLYGSALSSGYGEVGPAFSLQNGLANIQRYPAWWLESQGPIGLLCLVSLWRRRGAVAREFLVTIAFAVSAILLYLFYLPFDAWWYLRFVLPAIPVLLLLCADTVAWVARRTQTTFAVAMAVLLFVAGTHSFSFIQTRDVLGTGYGEERYPETALYLESALPADAAIITMQHSGSIRYYTGRLIVRWDTLNPEWLDRAVAFLNERGVATYAVLEYWEEVEFRQRFRGQQLLAELDRGPLATARAGETRIYPLGAPEAGRARTPVVIGPRPERTCIDVSSDYVAPRGVAKLR